MAYPLGKARPFGAGRKRGTPNKRTIELELLCANKRVNVFESMIDIAKNSNDENLKFHVLKELAQYLYPKRKAVEISASNEPVFRVIIEDYSSK